MCRAELRDLLGERARAESDYRLLITLDPLFTAPYLRQVYVSRAEGRIDETIRLCDGLLLLLQHAVKPDSLDSDYFAEQIQQLKRVKRECERR